MVQVPLASIPLKVLTEVWFNPQLLSPRNALAPRCETRKSDTQDPTLLPDQATFVTCEPTGMLPQEAVPPVVVVPHTP
jgi:hypothetical protein